MSAQAVLQEAAPYLDELEVRLARAVEHCPGIVASVGRNAVDAGGKRLRPLLVHLTSPDREQALRAGVAIELAHVATLVHDDLIDGAAIRRGRASVWRAHGTDAARAGGDYLFARAFAELTTLGDPGAVATLADAARSLARGEALQWRQLRDPETTVDEYLLRCELKTAKLFEAACFLGGRSRELAEFGRALGIAFQIVDDILDCAGLTIETGKVPGTDLREGVPTLPLLFAAREDEVVRRALAGTGPPDGALVRVAATGALERSREIALEHARRARAFLGGVPRSDELEALTHIVIDREQ
jgi:geranylgeranyl pyrophosphate synthase